MPIKVRSAADAAKKFVANAQAAGGSYTQGVKDAGQNWQEKAAASEGTWAGGVQQAITGGRYGRGIAKAGAARYVAQASSVGAQRYPQGVAQAGPTYQQNVQPFLDTIANVQLPPRMPKGDQANWNRSIAVGMALRQKKVNG